MLPDDGSREEQFEWLCAQVLDGHGRPYPFSVDYRYRHRHRESGLSRFITDVVFCLNYLQDVAQVDYLRYMISTHGLKTTQHMRRRLAERSSFGRGGQMKPGMASTNAAIHARDRLEFARREEEVAQRLVECDRCVVGGTR